MTETILHKPQVAHDAAGFEKYMLKLNKYILLQKVILWS